MANKRMFSIDVVNSDAFLDMPVSAQNFYFHLALRADDDGIIDNPNSIKRITNSSDSDLEALIRTNFIIPFDSGIVAVRHWKVHNTIQRDRYKPTVYAEEFSHLTIEDDNTYTKKSCNSSDMDSVRFQSVSKMESQNRLRKDLDYIPPTIPRGDVGVEKIESDFLNKSFENFWEKYPKQISKHNALKAWKRLNPNDEMVCLILTALEQHKQTHQWQKEDGRYIPAPAKWINNRRWEDKLNIPVKSNRDEYSFDIEEYKSLVNNFNGW